MEYDLYRNQAVHDSYARNVQDFLDSYRVGVPTIVMLPGGMGSQLDRSPTPYRGQDIPFSGYSPVWLSPGILFRGDGLTLEMDAARHDIQDYVIVPDGPLRYLVKAYDGTERYFTDQNVNYIVFGYDWRRPLEEAAVNLQTFLTALRRAVFQAHADDVTPRLVLLCHSQGGLVAKMFLDIVHNAVSAWVSKVITVATPFYGTATHMPRYFVGEHLLNLLYGAGRVAKIIGSLPGPYTLLPIDRATWRKRGAALGLGAETYPVVDEGGREIDPYDRAQTGAHGRYPAWVSGDYLDAAKAIRGAIDQDLEPAAVAQVFHLRATSTATPYRFRWRPLPADFSPDTSPLPFDDLPNDVNAQGGDGTVPWFSARLAQVPDARVYRIPTTALHQDLLENARALDAIWTIITTGRIPDHDPQVPDGPYQGQPTASDAEVDRFLSDAAAGRIAAADPAARDPRLWRGVVRRTLK